LVRTTAIVALTYGLKYPSSWKWPDLTEFALSAISDSGTDHHRTRLYETRYRTTFTPSLMVCRRAVSIVSVQASVQA
jgi:hypothetical protein